MTKATVCDEWKHRKIVKIYETKMPNQVGVMAREIALRFSLIAANADGEDSAGRQRLKLLSPAEVVQRACDLAEQLQAEFDRRGWMIDVPDLAEVNANTETNERQLPA